MEKILISIPHQLAIRMRTLIPARQRSKVFAHLIEDEITRREKLLTQCAMDVEKDQNLKKEMEDWDITLQDGLKNNESW